MKRRTFSQISSQVFAVLFGFSILASGLPVRAADDEAPDALIKRLSMEVLDTIKAEKSVQPADTAKVLSVVESKITPNVDFTRMTASAVGRTWRQASPEQKKRLQDEFKTLLVRTYSGALAEVKEQTIRMKPLRSVASDTEVIVRTEVLGRGDPIQLDYRMEKIASGWKIYDLNVLGVWLVENYRTQFAQEINTKGLDGLIASLTQRNKTNAAGNKS